MLSNNSDSRLSRVQLSVSKVVVDSLDLPTSSGIPAKDDFPVWLKVVFIIANSSVLRTPV
jgi:hypothetical protein